MTYIFYNKKIFKLLNLIKKDKFITEMFIIYQSKKRNEVLKLKCLSTRFRRQAYTSSVQ